MGYAAQEVFTIAPARPTHEEFTAANFEENLGGEYWGGATSQTPRGNEHKDVDKESLFVFKTPWSKIL